LAQGLLCSLGLELFSALMDAYHSQTFREVIAREKRQERKRAQEKKTRDNAILERDLKAFETKWGEQFRFDAIAMTTPVPQEDTDNGIQKSSASMNYLNQSMKLVRNPHTHDCEATPRELLLHGVSREGEGRSSYLRRKAQSGGPHERYGRAVLTSQEIGWSHKLMDSVIGSRFARRPAVKRDLFRLHGVGLSM